jgi:uncharacterized protein
MNKLPIVINNTQFASQKQVLSGDLDAMDFERLRDQLVSVLGQKNLVQYHLSGWVDVQNRAFLKLELKADLQMACQRCLAAMPLHLDLNFNYQITHQSEQELLASERLEDEVDFIEADANMDVGFLIEDELMMALPIAPVHVEACVAMEMSSGEKANPFAVLGKLKK